MQSEKQWSLLPPYYDWYFLDLILYLILKFYCTVYMNSTLNVEWCEQVVYIVMSDLSVKWQLLVGDNVNEYFMSVSKKILSQGNIKVARGSLGATIGTSHSWLRILAPETCFYRLWQNSYCFWHPCSPPWRVMHEQTAGASRNVLKVNFIQLLRVWFHFPQGCPIFRCLW